jgi:Protein of unknown function (DUF642)
MPAPQAGDPHCPRYAEGTGILGDGDFHKAIDPSGYVTPNKGRSFAPSWKVTVLNVDFAGTTFWNFDHLCSVDLDGESSVGGIEHHRFPTQKGATYMLSFLMSGNSFCGAIVKKMKVTVGNQNALYKWNVSNGHDVEDGVVAPRHLKFTAASSTTTLAFTSLDRAGSGCGPVIGAVSVRKS